MLPRACLEPEPLSRALTHLRLTCAVCASPAAPSTSPRRWRPPRRSSTLSIWTVSARPQGPVRACHAGKARRLLHALTGRHDYAGIKEDLNAWWPRVCSGGILAGHDYTDSGVARAVGEFFGTRQPGGLVFVTPDHPASFLVFKNPQHRARSRHAAFSHEAHAAARGPAGLGRDARHAL